MVAAQTSEMLEEQVRASAGTAGTSQEVTTNLLNRERIEQSFENARLRSAKTGLSLLVIDVTGFNGGRRPTELAEAIGLPLHESYELLQSGPEEFVVIMPQTNKANRELVSQHLHETLATREDLVQGLRLAGASGPSDGNTLSELIETARERLGHRRNWTEPQPDAKPSVH